MVRFYHKTHGLYRRLLPHPQQWAVAALRSPTFISISSVSLPLPYIFFKSIFIPPLSLFFPTKKPVSFLEWHSPNDHQTNIHHSPFRWLGSFRPLLCTCAVKERLGIVLCSRSLEHGPPFILHFYGTFPGAFSKKEIFSDFAPNVRKYFVVFSVFIDPSPTSFRASICPYSDSISCSSFPSSDLISCSLFSNSDVISCTLQHADFRNPM